MTLVVIENGTMFLYTTTTRIKVQEGHWYSSSGSHVVKVWCSRSTAAVAKVVAEAEISPGHSSRGIMPLGGSGFGESRIFPVAVRRPATESVSPRTRSIRKGISAPPPPLRLNLLTAGTVSSSSSSSRRRRRRRRSRVVDGRDQLSVDEKGLGDAILEKNVYEGQSFLDFGVVDLSRSRLSSRQVQKVDDAVSELGPLVHKHGAVVFCEAKLRTPEEFATEVAGCNDAAERERLFDLPLQKVVEFIPLASFIPQARVFLSSVVVSFRLGVDGPVPPFSSFY